jgi:DNA-binding CsgD family transcriptional regulator
MFPKTRRELAPSACCTLLLGRLADALPWPLVVLARDGRAVQTNSSGERVLTQARLLCRDAQGRVMPVAAKHRALFRTALARALGGEFVPLRGMGTPSELLGSISFLPSESTALKDRQVLLVLSPRAGSGHDVAAYAQARALTPAESRVLALLAEGLDAAASARELAVSAATVRAHLRSVRRKTGHANLANLRKEVTRLPPPLFPGPM